MKLFWHLLVLFVLGMGLFTIPSIAQKNYFYTDKKFGSEAMYNPLSLVLNSSYDILQLEGYPRTIFDFPYSTSSANVFRNLRDPFTPISNYGWGNFLRNEIFPINWSKSGRQWWPNYQLHLIGGGMSYTIMKEWYDMHGFPAPAIFSMTTLATSHLLNEFVENGSYQGDNVDPIADIYIFDLGGIVLFSFDSVNEFFSNELNLADWSLQPSFSFRPAQLHNNGQYFSLKWKFPFSERWHLFYECGMNGLLGLSYKYETGEAISFGGGMRSKHLTLIDPQSNQKSGELTWNVGVFYDRENSLLMSLLVSGLEDNMINVNVYPGIIKIGTFSPGVWCIIQRDGSPIVGVSTVWTPGVAVETK